MRNRNTIEFLGLWESLHNPAFNRVQFDTFRTEAGLNRFVMTLPNGLSRRELSASPLDMELLDEDLDADEVVQNFCGWRSRYLLSVNNKNKKNANFVVYKQ